ncbi:AraC family transcriptional regulator [Limisalsivibrio acetivorans]|uniref:AraC family transcriptional regulator n=1 Tax=Limisalsivibrio acetivorans TaxID=1304888 RepID=UPI001EE25E68|nr:AraC family transcriptional regulator [Limisalsivibrio acetivorans]
MKRDIVFMRKPEIKGVEVCTALRSEHMFPKHAHDDIYAFGVMVDGLSYCLEDYDERGYLYSGETALINPGMVHTGNPFPGTELNYRMLFITIDKMKDIVSDILEKDGVLPEFEQLICRNRFIFRRLNALTELYSSAEDLIEVETVLYTSVGEMLEGATSLNIRSLHDGYSEHRRIAEAKEMLSGNLEKKLSISDIASEIGTSRYHFVRIFKQSTGMAPHTYRTMKRIEKGRGMLRAGSSPADAALSAGFYDQSHFTRKFKDITGVTPGDYAAALK